LIAELALGVERELRAGNQHDAVVLEASDAYLRALQIDQDADRASGLARQRANHFHACLVLAGSTVGEVEADDVEAGLDHASQGRLIGRRRAKGCDDFGTARHVCGAP
jgi:hypothetical protein